MVVGERQFKWNYDHRNTYDGFRWAYSHYFGTVVGYEPDRAISETNLPPAWEFDVLFYGYDEDTQCGPGFSAPCVYAQWPTSESQSAPYRYWFSNLPDAYIDTTFSNLNEEPAIGGGAGNAYNIIPSVAGANQWYYFRTQLSGARTHRDGAAVYSQKMHHQPTGRVRYSCSLELNNPWCIWTDAPQVAHVPKWQWHAPESKVFDAPVKHGDYDVVAPPWTHRGYRGH